MLQRKLRMIRPSKPFNFCDDQSHLLTLMPTCSFQKIPGIHGRKNMDVPLRRQRNWHERKSRGQRKIRPLNIALHPAPLHPSQDRKGFCAPRNHKGNNRNIMLQRKLRMIRPSKPAQLVNVLIQLEGPSNSFRIDSQKVAILENLVGVFLASHDRAHTPHEPPQH